MVRYVWLHVAFALGFALLIYAHLAWLGAYPAMHVASGVNSSSSVGHAAVGVVVNACELKVCCVWP
jgi:hypothetical protein